MSSPRNVFFAIVVVAAGVSGLALLVAPGSTDRYFSWTLNPPAAAALVGGFYLASAVVFAWGMTLPWRAARALLVGVLGLAVPTLVLSLVHDEVFDFSRWQALAWMGLFLTAPVSATLLLVRGPRVERGPAVAPPVRAVLGALAVSLLVVGALIWGDETRADLIDASPVDLIRLTGTYLGAWCSFLGLLCGYATVAGGRDEARAALVTVGVAAAGAALAFVRMLGDIRHPAAALVVCGALAGVAVIGERATRVGPDHVHS